MGLARGEQLPPSFSNVHQLIISQSKKKKKSKKEPIQDTPANDSTPTATSTATPAPETSGAVKRDLAPKVEEADE